jgi:hypothetical protein
MLEWNFEKRFTIEECLIFYNSKFSEIEKERVLNI